VHLPWKGGKGTFVFADGRVSSIGKRARRSKAQSIQIVFVATKISSRIACGSKATVPLVDANPNNLFFVKTRAQGPRKSTLPRLTALFTLRSKKLNKSAHSTHNHEFYPHPPPQKLSSKMSSDEPPKKRRRTTASPAASAAPQSAPTPSQTKYRVKERTLVFSTRGIGHRERFLMQDLRDLLPHSKRDSKLDSKKRLHEAVNEVCEMKNCSSCLFFEARKRQDTYLWAGCVPLGPTAKFLVQNGSIFHFFFHHFCSHSVHTMAELKLTGNCLKGARPVLSFDRTFEATPELRLLRQLLTRVFNSPRGHPKTKPFVDHVFHFSWLDNRIWFRNYQVNFDAVSNLKRSKQSDPVLVEIGPRFVLLPIKIFEFCFFFFLFFYWFIEEAFKAQFYTQIQILCRQIGCARCKEKKSDQQAERKSRKFTQKKTNFKMFLRLERWRKTIAETVMHKWKAVMMNDLIFDRFFFSFLFFSTTIFFSSNFKHISNIVITFDLEELRKGRAGCALCEQGKEHRTFSVWARVG
jgi:hypothetical protein